MQKTLFKKVSDSIIILEDEFPIYRRRKGTNSVLLDVKNGFRMDNQYIIPYNLILLVKFQCHINVELYNKAKSIKYLFKYINKGLDRVKIAIEDSALPYKRQCQQQKN